MTPRIFNQEKTEEISDAEIDLTAGYLKDDKLGEEDIAVYVPITPEIEELQRKMNLRKQRERLLSAFDKWEKAVLRGREMENTEVMQWYQRLLDLEESAFSDIPERINYYLMSASKYNS